MPHYKIDALVRIKDLLRYDDRLYIQTNLIDAYEHLMDFVAKHLPDKFFLIGDQRISLRTHIFREIVANLIVHREYTNAHPCMFVIKNGMVEIENANIAHGSGVIDLQHFAPFAKNPTIAKFFAQLGRVDELGSGVINVNKHIHDYAGGMEPTFTEGHTFKMMIPIPAIFNELEAFGGATDGTIDGTIEGVIEAVIEGVTKGVKENLVTILKALVADEGKRAPIYKKVVHVSERTFERYLKQLIEAELIVFKGGANQTGGYHITNKFHDLLQNKTKTKRPT